MERIGVFGGSFNPVHIEHVKIAQAAINQFSLDKLIVMPTYISPHKKDASLAPAEVRIKALELAFREVRGATVSDYEIKKGGISFTYMTLEYLKNEYDAELYFLMGADMLADFPTWRKPDEIVSLAKIVVTGREGEDLAAALSAFYDRFGFRPFVSVYHGANVSSTKIRNYLTLGLPVSDMTGENVAEYLENERVYDGGEYAYCADYVKKALKRKRLIHTAGVMTLAESYAKRLGVDPNKARLAAMLHDVAKYMRYEDLSLVPPEGVPESVLHQFLGAYICENVLNIRDEDVLNAVRYHTTGRADMSTLEMIIFTADLLEEGRDYDEVQELRKRVDDDFDKGFSYCVKRMMSFLEQERRENDVYYLTRQCEEYYCK